MRTPLHFVAAMLAFALAIEIGFFGRVLLAPKLPLALLLTLAFVRARGANRAR